MISICLKNSDKIIDVETKGIFPEHMSVKGHKYILLAILYLKSKQVKPSPMSIMEVTSTGEAKKAIDELGGLDYLMLLEETRIPEENITLCIEKIKQSHTRNMLIQIAEETTAFAKSEQANVLNPGELIHFLESRIADAGASTNVSDETYKMGDETEEILRVRAETPESVPGLEVGWVNYDRLTNGAQAGDLIIICAPSKTGKSVVLTNWAKKISIIDSLPILYIDTEMSSREQEDRLLASLSGIPHSEIVSGMYVMDTVNGTADEKVAKLKRAREQLQMGNYYHIYMPHFSIESVTSIVRKFQLQFGIVALFFDYIKIPSNQGDFRSQQEYQALGFFTSGLKDIAGTMKIPVFTACQANRSDNKTEDPDESNIGGSYRILQLASKLMFLYNKSPEKIAKDGFQNGNQQLFVKFQRNGASDADPINIMFDKPILRMEEIS